MAPLAPAIALALAFGIGSRSGDSFCLQNLSWTNSAACSRRRSRPGATVVARTPTAGLAAQGEEGSGDRSDSNDSSRYEGVLEQTAADREGIACAAVDYVVPLVTVAPSYSLVVQQESTATRCSTCVQLAPAYLWRFLWCS